MAAHIRKSLLHQAQAVARRTLATLDRPRDMLSAFTAAFMTPHTPADMFDYLWTVEVPAAATAKHADASMPNSNGTTDNEAAAAGAASAQHHVAGDLPELRLIESRVESLVRDALRDRASLVQALPRPIASCSAESNPRSTGTRKKETDTNAHGVFASLRQGVLPVAHQHILVGAVVDPLRALRLVDVGPAADDGAAAAKFRTLWGDKAELRRFQDGKICEALVWQVGPDDRHTVPDRWVAASWL